MSEFLQFLMEHWVLSAAALVSILAFAVNEIKLAKGAVTRVSPQEAIQLINREGGVFIDLREKSAYREGHIVNAVNCPGSSFQLDAQQIQSRKSDPVVLVCARGQDSSQVGEQLKSAGFGKVVALSGGFEAWRLENLPIVK